jgi:hypothetical protein
MTHILKSYPQYFEPTILGLKFHEVRNNADTGPFAVGDTLVLREYDPATGTYTGREATTVVTYLSPSPKPWIVPNFTVLSSRLASVTVGQAGRI